MKNAVNKILVVITILLVATGCKFIEGIKQGIDESQKPQVLTAKDNSSQVTVPGGWMIEKDLNPLAVIQASNRIRELYVVVIREGKDELGNSFTLEGYNDFVRKNYETMLSNPIITDSANVKINGFDAKQFEAAGTVQNVKIKYVVATVETPNNYYQILTWTLPDSFEKNKGILFDVLNSFKELEGKENISLPDDPPAPVSK